MVEAEAEAGKVRFEMLSLALVALVNVRSREHSCLEQLPLSVAMLYGLRKPLVTLPRLSILSLSPFSLVLHGTSRWDPVVPRRIARRRLEPIVSVERAPAPCQCTA